MIVVSPLDVSGYQRFCGDYWGSSATAIGPRHVLCSIHQDVAFTARVFATDPGESDRFALAQPELFDTPAFDRFIIRTVTEAGTQTDTRTPVMRYGRAALNANPFDMMIVELDSELPGWHRCAGDAEIGDLVILAGRGRHSTTVPGSVADGATGWSYPSPPSFPTYVAFATNTAEDPASPYGTTFDILMKFVFTSPANGGPGSEGLAATNDSGGSAFVDVDGELILKGACLFGVAGSYDYGYLGAVNNLHHHLEWIVGVVCRGVRHSDRTYSEGTRADDQRAGSGQAWSN